MNDEENKLSTETLNITPLCITNFGYNEPPGASRTSLRYNELKFVISEDTELPGLAEQASYITNLSSLYLRLPNLFLSMTEQAPNITNL
ncbi:Hypothetical protein FKW44_021487, partial [Caligus rogercresseyi]